MSWIKVITERVATGKLKAIYNKLQNRGGTHVANILKVHSLNPDVLKAHLDLYRTIMYGKSNLSRKEREMVAVVVSATNDCHY